MKILVFCAFLIAFLGMCQAFSQPVIKDTKVDVTADGVTKSYCGYEGLNLNPDEQFNHVGHCQLLWCTKTFDIRITPCPFDMTGQLEWINKDDSKTYPECCGTERQKH